MQHYLKLGNVSNYIFKLIIDLLKGTANRVRHRTYMNVLCTQV
jgi:hypothetical protein